MSIVLDGTSGMTLPGAATSIQVGSLTLATAQTASGTSVDFTGIPSWVERITVLLSGVSTSGTSDVIVQLGTSSGVVSTDYLGSSITLVGSASPGASAYTSGFLIRLGGAAAATAIRHGKIVITTLGNNIWVGDVMVSTSNVVYTVVGSGSLLLSSALAQVRVTTVNGTDTFDAGTVNILYE
jgi:hypothetical protein